MTRAVAFVRSIEVAQAAPFLAQSVERLRSESVEPLLYYTDGVCTPADFPGRSRKLDPDVNAAGIWAALAEDGATLGASLSIPDENAVRDGFVKARVEAEGGRLVACDAEVAQTFANKWETKPLLGKHGFTVPPAVFVDGDLLNGRGPHYVEYHSVVREQVRRIGYPVLVKPLWDCLGNGVAFLADDGALQAFLAAPAPGNVLVEQCVTGTLCSVEVLAEGGRAFMQPIVWKGPAGGPPSFAFTQVRHTSTAPDLPGLDELRAAVDSLCAEPGVEGAIEFEFVYDGAFHCIEVNPRVSGSTGISIAASGVNTYYELARMALGDWAPPAAGLVEPHVALQFPVLTPEAPAGLPASVHRWNTFTVEGERYRNALVSVPRSAWREFERWSAGAAVEGGTVEGGTVATETAAAIAAVDPVGELVP